MFPKSNWEGWSTISNVSCGPLPFTQFYFIRRKSSPAKMPSRNQKVIFGNPKCIISDRGTCFTSELFTEYCEQEGVELVHITTSVPRGNGQIERVNRTVILVLYKLSLDDEKKWSIYMKYRHVDSLQSILNDSYQRSVNTTPFELLLGIKMRRKENPAICEMLTEEYIASFNEEREKAKRTAGQKICIS